MTVDDFYAALDWLSARYANNDTIIAYDLKNEPHGKPSEPDHAIWNDSEDANNWRYVAQTAGNIILDNNTKAAGRVLVRAPQSLNATENEQAKYDYITLVDKVVTGVEPKAPAASATTADPAILAVVSLAAASGAAFVSKKRK